MSVSVFDLFKIGIGPSSSHTVGPMRAAKMFIDRCNKKPGIVSLQVGLYGSLAATGRGHGTDKALVLGLMGEQPDQVDPDQVDAIVAAVTTSQFIGKTRQFKFNPACDLLWHPDQRLPAHPNGMHFMARDCQQNLCLQEQWFSVGGGFVATAGDIDSSANDEFATRYEFNSAKELIALCHQYECSLSELMWQRELSRMPADEVCRRLKEIWSAMEQCIARGFVCKGTLPGGLNIRRRAPGLYQSLLQHEGENIISSSLRAMDWINLYALAVNEENAAGGRVVTAPTNGAAGIVPAVLKYLQHFYQDKEGKAIPEKLMVKFFMAATAIGILCKKNASLSGAEVGCQGEVGSACAMAAAGLAEALGATPEQVENAAEIGLEHNLGLTCDPVAGLVQVPCIERNAIAAVKAVNAAQLALRGDGKHFVSLDKVIRTLKDTGADMQDKYKETSTGGLAVNLTEC